MKTVTYTNCPFDWDVSIDTTHANFNFLEANKPESGKCENFEASTPSAFGVHWASSLPGAKQNRYVKIAESAAYEQWTDICLADGHQQGALPNTLGKEGKLDEVISTAVDCALNLYSSCDSGKIRIMTKSLMLLFLHDDVVEYAYAQEDNTLLDRDAGIHGTSMESLSDPHDRGALWNKLVRETLRLDPIWGPQLLKDMVIWGKFTKSNKDVLPESFATFPEFFAFREGDIAKEYITSAIRFSCEFGLKPSDVGALADLEKLQIRHFVLTNDLFSFNKELCERDTTGAALINTVEYLRSIIGTSIAAAKSMALNLIWEVEAQMHQTYTQGLTHWTEAQILYAQRIIESCAGNFYYSATTYRYSKQAIKTHEDYAATLNPASASGLVPSPEPASGLEPSKMQSRSSGGLLTDPTDSDGIRASDVEGRFRP